MLLTGKGAYLKCRNWSSWWTSTVISFRVLIVGGSCSKADHSRALFGSSLPEVDVDLRCDSSRRSCSLRPEILGRLELEVNGNMERFLILVRLVSGRIFEKPSRSHRWERPGEGERVDVAKPRTRE